MAVTRIWAVKDNLSRVLDYAANKKKTDLSKYGDLIDALHYAADEEKANTKDDTYKTNEEALDLLKGFGLPFKK